MTKIGILRHTGVFYFQRHSGLEAVKVIHEGQKQLDTQNIFTLVRRLSTFWTWVCKSPKYWPKGRITPAVNFRRKLAETSWQHGGEHHEDKSAVQTAVRGNHYPGSQSSSLNTCVSILPLPVLITIWAPQFFLFKAVMPNLRLGIFSHENIACTLLRIMELLKSLQNHIATFFMHFHINIMYFVLKGYTDLWLHENQKIFSYASKEDEKSERQNHFGE